ncbi:hypothetical protein MMC32_003528 [Xylographa parallela]|nr:hypothetical protein [Xylographa parallela]
MENTIHDVSSHSEAPLPTIPAVIEAALPAANQPADTDSAVIAPEVLMFLNEFFLAMQIPPTEFTEDQERIFRHSQAVLLKTLIDAHRIERHLDRLMETCVRFALAVEQRSLELDARELISAQTGAIRVNGERLGARIRRAGLAVRSIFRRSHREAERRDDNEDGQLE